MRKVGAACLVVLWAMGSSSALADLYHVSVDLSDLSGNIQLQAALYDNSDVLGDSWARMDNVILGSAIDDFESGTLGGFVASPADGVNAVAGNLNGAGNFVMRLDEDLELWPTFAYQDYLSPNGDTLAFDLEVTASATVGSWGKDEFVISILDPGFNPLFEGLTGFGDVLVINADGVRYTDVVTLTPVPLPAAVLLGLLGFGTAALGLKRQR